MTRKKVLAVDLDNTIWKGVLGDEGMEVTEPFRSFQRALIDLQHSGVLLVILSKNDEQLVLQTLQSHPDLLLELEDFVAIRCNWEPKPENLLSIAEELNLGIDSFVFFDDSEFERAMMERMLPEVDTLFVPDDPAQYVAALNLYSGFDARYLTGEDLFKTESYHTFAAQRKQADTMNTDDFLESLEMVATIEEVNDSNFNRVHQLISKTNQFNLNVKRQSPEALKRMLYTHEVYAISLKDTWGDSGVIGVLIWKTVGTVLEVDTFILSCRVLKRTVEHSVMEWLIRKAAGWGVTKIIAEYRMTDRNGMIRDFLIALDFLYTGGNLWQLELGSHFVTVEEK